MPIIVIRQLPGRTAAQKKALAERITRAVRDVYGPTAQPVQVLIEEMDSDGWFSEGAQTSTLPRDSGR